MGVIKITIQPELTKNLFKEYFRFQRGKELKKFPSKFIFGFCFLIILIGITTQLQFITAIGVISLIITALFIIIFFLRYELIGRKYLNSLDTFYSKSEKEFIYSFDKEGISMAFTNSKQHIEWSYISRFEQNKTEIYLYDSKEEMIDIISPSILGKQEYDLFREILIEKVNN